MSSIARSVCAPSLALFPTIAVLALLALLWTFRTVGLPCLLSLLG